MFQSCSVISVGLFLVFTCSRITEGLVCDRSTVMKGTPCQNNGEIVSGTDACEAMAPRCCSYSVGFLNCFVNKEYKENQGHDSCAKEGSLFTQLSINSDKHDELFAVGGLLSTHQVVSELHCLDLCYRDYLCKAYNYQYGSGGRSELKVCELLVEVDTIGTRRGFRYRIVDHDQRKVLFTNSGCKTTN